MTQSIVLELQRDAFSGTTPISDLLRKAMFVARKLDVPDFIKWTNCELNGYEPDDSLPNYRIIASQLYVDTIAGLKLFIFEDDDLNKLTSKAYIRQGIGEIYDLSLNQDSRQLVMSIPSKMSSILSKMCGYNVRGELHLSKSSFSGIVDAVRNAVLEWSLELEKQGVLGEDMTFSYKEKELASQASSSLSYINIGSMINSQIQQSSNDSIQNQTISHDQISRLKDFVSEINKQVDHIQSSMHTSDHEEAKAEIVTLETQLSSPRPKKMIILESLNSIRRILEGAGGDLLAKGVLDSFPLMIAMLSHT